MKNELLTQNNRALSLAAAQTEHAVSPLLSAAASKTQTKAAFCVLFFENEDEKAIFLQKTGSVNRFFLKGSQI